MARKVACKVVIDPGRWTRNTMKHDGITKADREVFADAMTFATESRWVIEKDEPGQGRSRRSLWPGPKRP